MMLLNKSRSVQKVVVSVEGELASATIPVNQCTDESACTCDSYKLSTHLTYFKEIAYYYRTAYLEEMERSNNLKKVSRDKQNQADEYFKRCVKVAVAHKLERLEADLRMEYDAKIRKRDEEKEQLIRSVLALKKTNRTLLIKFYCAKANEEAERKSQKLKLERIIEDYSRIQDKYIQLIAKYHLMLSIECNKK